MNIILSLILLLIIPSLMYLLGKKSTSKEFYLNKVSDTKEEKKISGAEKLDHSKLLAFIIGSVILCFAFYKAVILPSI